MDVLHRSPAAARRNSALLEQCRRQSKHRRLLLDLAVAADDGQRWTPLQTLKQLPRFDRRPPAHERVVRRRIVHAGEHEVLPDQDAELVAQVVEEVGLVDHRAADADHVDAGVAQTLERGAIATGIRIESGDIQRSPADTAAEHWNAVDAYAETLAVGVTVDLQGAETYPAKIDLDSACIRIERHSHRKQRLPAMCMRPPALDVRGTSHRATGGVSVAGWLEDNGSTPLLPLANNQPAIARRICRINSQQHRHPHDSVRAIELGANPRFVNVDRPRLEPDRPPRSDRSHGRTPPWYSSQQGRAMPP